MLAETSKRRDELAKSIKQLDGDREARAGQESPGSPIVRQKLPEVYLLERGNHSSPGEEVEPAPLAALAEPECRLAHSRRRSLAH